MKSTLRQAYALLSKDMKMIKVSITPERICVVHLNDPKRFNAMTESMGEEFETTMTHLAKSFATKGEPKDRVRGLVLTGEGKAFSAGGDINFLQDRIETNPLDNSHIMKRFYERFLSVRKVPVPTVAAINGPAIGAGLAVALACDFRVSAPEAKLGVTFTGLGIHPGMGSSHFLPLITTPQHAHNMLFMSTVVSGQEGGQMGLCEVADDPYERAIEMANKMAQMPEAGIRTLVGSLRSKQNIGLEQALWREATSQAECYGSEEFKEAVLAMKEKLEQKRAAKSKANL